MYQTIGLVVLLIGLLIYLNYLKLTIITLLLFVACWFNNMIRYYTKFTIFLVGCLLAATLPVPFMLHRPKDWRNGLIPSWLCLQLGKLLGVKSSVRGTDNIVKNSGAVVLLNHQSALDLTVLGQLYLLMDNCTQIAKSSIFYLWPFGLACWLWGTIFIDRVNASDSQKKLNSQEDAIKNKKSRILMFPEGTRGDGVELLPFKKGAFHLAVSAQCPIQPIVISRYHFLDSNRKSFGRGELIVTILPGIKTVGLTKNDIPKLIEQTRNAMIECFNRTSKETQMLIN